MIPFLPHLVRHHRARPYPRSLWPCEEHRPAGDDTSCSTTLGAGRGTAGGFCSHCIQRANIRKWNLTQFMKRSPLSLAALCCHKPGRLGEGCEQQSCRAGGAAWGQEPQQGWPLRGIKIWPWRKNPTAEVQPRRQEKPAIGFANPVALEQLWFLLHGNSLMLWSCGTLDTGCDAQAAQCVGLVLCGDLGRKSTQEPRDL